MDNAISRVDDVSLYELLPESIKGDDQLMAVCDALDQQMTDIAEDIEVYLPFLPNLDNIPERIVDLLAWQYHVDDYDPAADIAIKRGRVMSAIADHRIQGTPKAVKNVLDAMFGKDNYSMFEWFEYGGEPYHFRVVATTSIELTEDFMTRLENALVPAKNVRSWYDLSIAKNGNIPFTVNVGIVSHRILMRRCVAQG
ncbi:MAG: phage tail protein I [Armatimonadota bacterium]